MIDDRTVQIIVSPRYGRGARVAQLVAARVNRGRDARNREGGDIRGGEECVVDSGSTVASAEREKTTRDTS